jgi:hypothetical protein
MVAETAVQDAMRNYQNKAYVWGCCRCNVALRRNKLDRRAGSVVQKKADMMGFGRHPLLIRLATWPAQPDKGALRLCSSDVNAMPT